MESPLAYRQLELRYEFDAQEWGAVDAVLGELVKETVKVYQYFYTDYPDLQHSLLVRHAASIPDSVLRTSIFVDPQNVLTAEWVSSIAQQGPYHISRREPGKSMTWRYGNPWAVLLFQDSYGDWVCVSELPRKGTFKVQWSWGDPNQQLTQLKKLLEELLKGDEPEVTPPPPPKPPIIYPPSPPPKPPNGPTTGSPSGGGVEEPPTPLPASLPRMQAPEWLELRPYQDQAIQAWAKNDGRGILAMATGSGKTLTALALAARVARKNKPLVLLIICPFVNLCNQWMEEIAEFGIQAIPAYQGRSNWEQLLQEGYQTVAVDLKPVMAVITTTSTFQTDAFQRLVCSKLSRYHHFLIADEVHNLGAKKIQKCLPSEVQLRLGLSATPERHHDPEGTTTLMNYFGNIVFEYPIERAIDDGGLCPYLYYPHVVQLTDEEAEQYAVLTQKLGRILCRQDDDAELGQSALSLLIRRARLLASAQNKIPALDRVLRELPAKPEKALFYCGDGRTTDSVAQEERRQIEAVARLLGEQHNLRVRNFTYREKAEEREQILMDLGSGLLDGVVAIRCLDEGIDLPDLRMGFLLASSTNPRQFIQRRGRLLRKAEGKDFAIIHDFIIEPPDFGGWLDDDTFNMERRFFKRELNRIGDFCRTAENGQDALNRLRELRLKYNVLAI